MCVCVCVSSVTSDMIVECLCVFVCPLLDDLAAGRGVPGKLAVVEALAPQ